MSMNLHALKQQQLDGHAIAVCYGAGVDSTAMLMALADAGITPDVITFADTRGEKPETYKQLHTMNMWLLKKGWPLINKCAKETLATTSYNSLGGNCSDNATLPSLAFGMKSCSIKWKQVPQDYFLMGCTRGPMKCDPHQIWLDAQSSGKKIIKLIGYDSSPADIRRSSKIKMEDDNFLYSYPLQDLGWTRVDCTDRIQQEGMPVPVKSACWFCPASQKWELFWLAGTHPVLFEQALDMEHGAMLGKHSRWGKDHDDCSYGQDWLELVQDGSKAWPSTKTTVGLGRGFSWNRWAVENGLVEWVDGKRILTADPDHCKAMAQQLQAEGGNARDRRTC